MAKILILTALPMEAREIRRVLRRNPLRDAVDLRCIGLRGVHLAQRVPLDEVTANPPSAILLVGVAGGLDPSLRIGDVVLDSPKRDSAFKFRCHRGRIHTEPNMVTLVADKRAIFTQTGALAVDMELAIVRQYFAAASMFVICIRSISDTAHHTLPSQISNWLTPDGRPRLMRILRDLAMRPHLLIAAYAMRSRMNFALSRLQLWSALRQLLEEPASER